MATTDYINLAIFVLLIIGFSLDIALYARLRNNLRAAIQIIAELVLIHASDIKDTADASTRRDATSLSSRTNDLLRNTR